MYETGINQDNAQQINRELVLRFLRKNEGCSRIELAKMTNLKPATITNIINDFQDMGIVREMGTISEGKGRSAIRLALNPESYTVVSVRLTRKEIIVGAFDIRGDKLQTERFAIKAGEKPEYIIRDMKQCIHKAIDEWAVGEVAAIGCAVPGPFLREEGMVALMTGASVWKDVNIREELEKEFGLPIFMEHDANAGALAYYWRNGSELQQTLVYMAVGQGVGAGIVQNGELLVGRLGVAGEIGHMSISYNGRYCECGNRGCLETYCSTLAFTKEINRKILDGNYSVLRPNSTFEEIVEAIKLNDRLAVDEYRSACDLLAVGVINIINILNPDVIVMEEDMAAVAPDILKESLEKVVKPSIIKEMWDNLKIVIGEGDKEAVLAGVSILAMDEVLRVYFRK